MKTFAWLAAWGYYQSQAYEKCLTALESLEKILDRESDEDPKIRENIEMLREDYLENLKQ